MRLREIEKPEPIIVPTQSRSVNRQPASQKSTTYSQTFKEDLRQNSEMRLTEDSQRSLFPSFEFTVKVTGPEQHLHTHRRLKLKDYLHLNGLQKRNRSKDRSRSKEGSKLSIQLDTKQKAKNIESPIQLNALKAQVQSKCSNLVSPNKTQEQQYIKLIRQEIEAKIQLEKKKLQDLRTFLNHDYISRSNKSQSFVFLFSIYNKLVDMHKLNDEVGEAVIDYVKDQPKKYQVHCEKTRSKDYHWVQQKKELQSPAKISRQALNKSKQYAQYLGIQNSH